MRALFRVQRSGVRVYRISGVGGRGSEFRRNAVCLVL